MLVRTALRRARIAGLVLSAFTTAAVMPPASLAAQDSDAGRMPRSAYARAEQMLPANLKNLVLNAYVIPHWIDESDEFWYERELKDGHEFVIVNAATGTRQPAFDHARLADVLGEASGKKYGPTNLPFQRFDFGPNRNEIIVTVEGVEYTLPIAEGAVRKRLTSPSGGEFVLSPDGKSGITTRNGDLWLRNMASGNERTLTKDGEPDAGYGIWPDGYHSNYVPRTRKGAPQPPIGLQWSPDSSYVVVPRFDQRHVLPYPMLNSAPTDGRLRPQLYQPRLALVGERPATVEWYAIEVATGDKRQIRLPEASLLKMQADILPLGRFWWRNDSRHLYAVAYGDNMESAYLFDIDVETGAARTVITEEVLPRTDLNTTSYNLPNVWVSGDGQEVIWFSQRDGWGHLYLYDARTGKLSNRITRGDWLVRDIMEVDQTSRVVYFTASGREEGNPYHRYLYRVDFDGSNLRLLTPEPADHILIQKERLFYAPDEMPLHQPFSPSGDYVVYNYSAVDNAPSSAIRSTRDGSLVAVVEKADTGALSAAGWRAPEEFTAKAADGKTDIHGVLYKPSDFDPTTKYPVLDAQYAAPLISVTPRNHFQAYAQQPGLDQAAYAELGFIVVTVDGRGTTGRSKAFAQATYGQLNTNGLADHVAAIKQLAADRPYMDVERVGIYGVSYGGYMTIRAMLEFPDFFKAGIATAGIAVMPGMYSDYHWSAFHGRPRYADGGELRSLPGEIPSNWAVLDARRQVDRLQGKLYIQFSELDENVLPGQMMAFVDALIAEHKPFDMLYLPGRAHDLLSEPYVLQRNWDFMVRSLLHREPPENFRLETGGR